MKVEVVCFGVLRDFLPEGTSGNRAALDVDDEAVVGDLVDRLGAPRRLVYALLVNGERADLDRSLASGDEITIMPPFSGGRGAASAGPQSKGAASAGPQSKGARGTRCGWVGTDERMVHYHDTEWGVPAHEDRLLYEFLVLEGAQAGLSWSTVLNKRDGYRNAFADFDPTKVVRYSEKRIARLLNDTAIIRNRQKVNAAILNARAFLKVQDDFGSFDSYQ
ncbi:MAG: DNA-3-methyladenine glycosylase I, partial [Actinomycetota bacterium]